MFLFFIGKTEVCGVSSVSTGLANCRHGPDITPFSGLLLCLPYALISDLTEKWPNWIPRW